MRETFGSRAPVGVLEQNPFLQCGQPRNVDRTNAASILSVGNLSNLCSSDVGTTQFVTTNCGSTDLSDGGIRGRRRNNLDALLKPKCSHH